MIQYKLPAKFNKVSRTELLNSLWNPRLILGRVLQCMGGGYHVKFKNCDKTFNTGFSNIPYFDRFGIDF